MNPPPTVGRIVHYFPDQDTANPLAAIVTRVWSPTCVNLQVFEDGSSPSRVKDATTSVQLRDESNKKNVWDWPARD